MRLLLESFCQYFEQNQKIRLRGFFDFPKMESHVRLALYKPFPNDARKHLLFLGTTI